MNKYVISEILAVLGAVCFMLAGHVGDPWSGWPEALQAFGIGLLLGAFVAAFFPRGDGP